MKNSREELEDLKFVCQDENCKDKGKVFPYENYLQHKRTHFKDEPKSCIYNCG